MIRHQSSGVEFHLRADDPDVCTSWKEALERECGATAGAISYPPPLLDAAPFQPPTVANTSTSNTNTNPQVSRKTQQARIRSRIASRSKRWRTYSYVLIFLYSYVVMLIESCHGYLSMPMCHGYHIVSPIEWCIGEPMPVFFYHILQYHYH